MPDSTPDSTGTGDDVAAPAETTPPDTAATPKKVKKKRTWKRRFFLLAIVLLIVGLLFRIAVQVAFPIVLGKVAAGYGLETSYDYFTLSMLGGDVGLGRLEFKATDTKATFASANYVRATISPLKLLTGKLEVWRVEADGVDLNVTREADGSMPVIDAIMKAPAQPPPVEKKVETESGPKQFDLTAPAQVQGFRLQHLRLHLKDNSLNPPLTSMVQLDVRVDDMGSPTRPAQFYLNVYSDPVLDALTIEGEGRTAGAVVQADVKFSMKGLHLRPLAGYLEPLGIKPVAYDLSATANGSLNTTPAALVAAATQIASATQKAPQPAVAVTVATSKPAMAFPKDAKPAEAISGSLKLTNLALLADGQEAAACDQIDIDLNKADFAMLHLSRILIDGVRLNAVKTADGNMSAAGIELIPVFPSATTQPAAITVAATTPATPAPTATKSTLRASLDEFIVRNVRVAMEDRSVIPVTPLSFEVSEFSIRDVLIDSDKPDAAMKIAGAFKSPGVARQISLEGSAAPFGTNKKLNLTFNAEGIEPVVLKPYLDYAGLESQLKNASFTANVTAQAVVAPSGQVDATARLGNISFRDGDELFGLKDVKFEGVSLDPIAGSLRVQNIEVIGPALAFKRLKDGRLAGFGFHTKTPTPMPQRQKPPAEPSGLQLGRFELVRFSWTGIGVRFDDEMAVPPTSVAIGDAGLEVTGLVLDLQEPDPSDMPGRIRGWLSAPNVADKLLMGGTLSPTPKSFAADLLFSGQGITGTGLASYLKTFGIEPVLKDGSFTARARATLATAEQGIKASLLIDDVVYADGNTELIGVNAIKIPSVEMLSSGLAIGPIEIVRPRAAVLKEKSGAFVAGGIRYAPPAPQNTSAPAAAPATLTFVPQPVSRPSTAPPPAPAQPFVITLAGLKLAEASLQWTDESTAKPVQTTARVDVDLGSVTLGNEGPPTDLKVLLKADDIVDRLDVTGTVSIQPKTQGVKLQIAAAGVRGTALAAYLPAGSNFHLKDGRFAMSLDAGIEQSEGTGLGVHMKVAGLDFRDGTDGPTLLKLENFSIVAPRIDPEGGAVTIDEVVLNGFEMETVKSANSEFQAFGLSLGAPATPASEASTTVAEATPPASVPAASPPAPQSTTAVVPADVATLIAKAKKALPLITLNNLDLNVKRIGYQDQSQADAKPLAIADLRFRSLEKVLMLGEDPAGQPPAKFELTGRVDPLIGGIDVQMQTAPFAQQPTLNVKAMLSKIDGQGLFAIAPNLEEMIDSADLTDGQFKTSLEVTAKIDRRSPTDIDFSKGLDIEALVKGTEFRAKPDGPVLLGLDELRVEEAKIRPKTKSVRIKSIDLSKPIGQMLRDKQGIRVAGLLIKMPVEDPSTKPAAKPTVASSQPAPASPPIAQTPTSAPAVVAKPEGEIRIDKFTISGIEFRAEDRSVEPPVILPLTAMDVEVRDLSSLAMYEEKPIRFSANLNSGKITLPKKLKGGVLGAVGDAANLLGGQKVEEKQEFEEREVFAQIGASGKVVLYPKPDGWAKLNISSFELPSIAGLAKQQGIDLSHGTFDLPLDVRGDGKGGFTIDTNASVTDLSVVEPANGPISRFLALPAPLDAAIFAAEAADKSITIPVRGVTIAPDESGKFTVGGIGKQIAPAVGSVFITALASAPMKAVTGLAAATGIDTLLGGADKPEVPVVLTFPSGFTGLEAAELAKVQTLADRMKKEPELTLSIKHDLGSGDVSTAEVRANPTTADAEAIAYSLRQRKIELTQSRYDVAAATRTRLASGGGAGADDAVQQLRSIDQELSRTEDALDRMYELLRPGADRQAPRRTRAAALDFGKERLAAVREVLVASGVVGLDERLKAAKPAFAPGESKDGGTVTITLVKVKK